MNHLRRELAPIAPEAWALVEDEARRVLKTHLAGRKLVDFDGPHGWAYSAVNLGRVNALSFPKGEDPSGSTVETRLRQTLPLMELRVPFQLPLAELEAVERGASDVDLAPVAQAAHQLAEFEDRAIFYGVPDAFVQGIVASSAHEAITVSDDFTDFPAWVSAAIARLRDAGVDGPYAIALDAQAYTALSRTTGSGGYPVLQHVRRLVDGPTVWAPALRGSLLLSTRGGDFELVVGQDISVGYLRHGEQSVQLYLEESVTFRLLGPEAAVLLTAAR